MSYCGNCYCEIVPFMQNDNNLYNNKDDDTIIYLAHKIIYYDLLNLNEYSNFNVETVWTWVTYPCITSTYQATPAPKCCQISNISVKHLLQRQSVLNDIPFPRCFFGPSIRQTARWNTRRSLVRFVSQSNGAFCPAAPIRLATVTPPCYASANRLSPLKSNVEQCCLSVPSKWHNNSIHLIGAWKKKKSIFTAPAWSYHIDHSAIWQGED